MEFDLSIFLYIYYAFLTIWGFFCLVAIYHMLKFGVKNFTTFLITLVFIGIAVIMLYFSFYYIDQIDWGYKISIFEGFFGAQFPFE